MLTTVITPRPQPFPAGVHTSLITPLNPPFLSRVVSYKQRKTKTEFQSLSPRGGEVWREGKSHATFTRNQDLCIFLFSYETTLLNPPFLRGEIGNLVPSPYKGEG